MVSACASTPAHVSPVMNPASPTAVTFLHQVTSGMHSRASSRPSSSSSNSSFFAYLPSASSLYSYSSMQLSPVPCYSSPTSPAMTRVRPLPTPPATPLQMRSPLPPRPLPEPPLQRRQSEHAFRSTPLPTPPTSARTPPAQYSTCPPPALPIPAPEAPTSAPVPQSATPERPSIRLEIPMGSPSEQPVSPLSPIVFSIPGSREVRMRREQELARRMKDSGFQEARSPTEPPDHKSGASELTSGPSRSRVCAQELSPAYTDSDDERDVVLLLEHDSDMEECPTRSASRAAMLALFSDGDDESDSGSVPKLWQVPEHEHERRNSSHLQAQVDVKVEVVTREAVARTKRRFSRKWIRERRGKRWTEDDFGEIISQLRKLR